ncbi:methyltransferase [Aliiglaciecola sp. LCG003]|uniref:methyltransferase n=1 Tax=Aliiglaciecola sp. LCG003 TaxID=3053655 RepID=UPI0025744E8F|nr:methyltransferase [Aliiglaciecola sp. LCG003]WJG09731.1 methyltransferase [Aliiglaciecola sp. LCG003]
MLSATSQVVIRNKEQFEDGKWLLVNPPEAAIFEQLDNANLYGFHQYYDVYQQCISQLSPKKHLFSVSYSTDDTFDGAIIYMPKSKEQASMLIANVAACVKPSGNIFVVGENKSGIKTAEKLCAKIAIQVNKIDSARHCALYCAQLKEQGKFELADWIQYHDVNVNDVSCSMAAIPGVFNSGALDAGSRLLIENLPSKVEGNILDFACGNGVIGCFISKLNPTVNMTLSDVSAIALHCTELSLQRNNLTATVTPSDGLQHIQQTFDHVFTNPPFHSGVKTDYSITEAFLASIKKVLKPKAKLTLVANRFLPYPDLIKQALGKVITIAQTTKFSVYRNG